MDVNVQFADSTQAVIITYFAGPQAPGAYANIGAVATTDARWATFYSSLPVGAQSYLPAPTT